MLYRKIYTELERWVNTVANGQKLKTIIMPNDQLYTISEVVDLTGATEFLLRTWEFRYKFVRPKRTKTGRRLYSTDDVMRISKIVQLSQQGYKISHLAGLKWSDLSQLEISSKEVNSQVLKSLKMKGSVHKVFEALSRTDWISLKNHFETQRRKSGVAKFVYDFVLPVSREMSRRSMEKSLDIIQEHLLTSLIKESLYRVNGSFANPRKKFRIIFATPEGDYHDLGILISKVIAELKGHHCVYLGSHVPKKELSEACVRLKPTHVVIGTSFSSGSKLHDPILKYLNFIDRHIPQDIELWVGGSGAHGLVVKMHRVFAILNSLEEYSTHLEPFKEEKVTV